MKKAKPSPPITVQLPHNPIKLISQHDNPAEALLQWHSGKVFHTPTHCYLTKNDIQDLALQGYDAVTLCDPYGKTLVTIPFSQQAF